MIHSVNGLMQHGNIAVMFKWRSVLMLWLVLLVGLPLDAHALGFGTLILSSHLHEELKAEVPLMLSASDDINAVHIALASPSDYRQVGLAWQPELARIKVFIQDKHGSQPRVVLRSTGAISATMLSILLKAQKTGRGTYYKHFQLLFDPVEIVALRQPKPIVVPLHAAPDAAIATTLHQQPDQGWARIWRYGPVRAGDSLSEIAYRLRRDKRYSNRQVVLALYKQNPQGFVDGDINQLKQGAWLAVPRGKVVKQYAGKAAMHTLSLLLTRHHASAATLPINTPTIKPVAASSATETVQSVSERQSGQELRYSGNIAINAASARPVADALKAVQNNVSEQFDAMHAEMMAGQLQMADLGKSVSGLKQSMQGIRQDIHALRKDVAMIKNRSTGMQSEAFDNWQLALFAMLAGLLGALLAIVLQKKPAAAIANVADKPDAAAAVVNVADKPSAPVAQQVDNPRLPDAKAVANQMLQLLNQAEESLGKCEYKKAEQLLAQADKHSPDSLRATALKAQLYHETDRHSARDELINNMSEDCDKQRWENFCNLLPSQVWNACFGGDTTASDEHENNDA